MVRQTWDFTIVEIMTTDHRYTDSDWAGSAADRKSTSGGCYCLGSAIISWFSKKQSSVSLGTAEEEYIATFSAS